MLTYKHLIIVVMRIKLHNIKIMIINVQQQINNIEYPVAMSRYGQQGLKKDFGADTTYIPHGVDTKLFKPRLNGKYGKFDKPDAFVVGCVARNQHRKNIPRLVKGFAQFVKNKNLSPKEAKLILHMDWMDAMGWQFPTCRDALKGWKV